jgi:hypothetical protein
VLTEQVAPTRRVRFRGWRTTRPFWGGALLIASGLFLLLPAYTTFHIGDVLITISTISGVSTLLLGALMLLCGTAPLIRPTVRLPAGASAMIIALVALPAANFGGFIIGTLLGVVGASLLLAWGDSAEPATSSN